jgi:hypothetical protein
MGIIRRPTSFSIIENASKLININRFEELYNLSNGNCTFEIPSICYTSIRAYKTFTPIQYSLLPLVPLEPLATNQRSLSICFYIPPVGSNGYVPTHAGRLLTENYTRS